MRGDSESSTHGPPEFLVHNFTGRVGLVVDTDSGGIEVFKTIEFAGGERMKLSCTETRPADLLEIEGYHRTAAMIRPVKIVEFERNLYSLYQ